MRDHNGTELCECVTTSYAIEALYVRSQINILPHGRWKREVAVQLLSLNSLQGPLARAKTVAKELVNVLAVHQVAQLLALCHLYNNVNVRLELMVAISLHRILI